MALSRSSQDEAGPLRLGRGERLTRIERIVVLVVLVGVASVDLFELLFTPRADILVSLLSIATSAAFALYLWSPLVATCMLGSMLALSFFTETQPQTLLAAAVAAALIMRLGWTSLILVYTAAFLVAAGIIATLDRAVPVNVGIYLIVATVAGAIGFALRMASARGRRLEQELAEKARQEREAVLAERRWIAGELHDSIAHHLTVVSLHVQLLDDGEARPASQEAIRVAAKKAMADLRFVIELADDAPSAPGMQTGDLEEAVAEARGELEAAGHEVVCEGEFRDERLTRAGEIIFARVVRESVTNILKYAGGGAIGIRLRIEDDAAHLTIDSPLPTTPRKELSSSRTGLGRMAERVLGASGDFSAGEVDGRWRVSARLPVA
ncbi:sensor histidine kinase [Microbacterium sp.]|uniref:sensor histidine kinase n=1 Tax=Microbacterium sp. TaxID=51671 RepID=UPI00281180B7|nr:histidine kinase [Microbacterium sp.]